MNDRHLHIKCTTFYLKECILLKLSNNLVYEVSWVYAFDLEKIDYKNSFGSSKTS